MPESLVAVSQFTTTPPTIPIPGELVGMQTGPAPIKPVFQMFADRNAFALDAVTGMLDWNGEISIDPGGSNAVFSVDIGHINAAVFSITGAYKVLSSTPQTIGASKIDGGGVLPNNTWMYLYAFDNAGVIDFEISTVVPSTPRRTKQGDGTRRYLGCFRTDGAGAPIALRAVRGRYIYRAFTTGLITSQNTADTTTWTGDLSIAARIPPHARIVTMHVMSTRAVGGAAWGIRASGDTLAAELVFYYSLSALQFEARRLELALGATQAVQVATEGSTTIQTIDVIGWSE